MVNSSPKAARPTAPAPSGMDSYFEISKRGSTLGREVRGGLVTFFTMAYIIVLNPLIIGTTPDKAGNLITGVAFATATDADKGASIAAVAVATALIAGLTTILMGAYARFPIALATGLGLNAVVAYTIAPQMTWPQAMGLVVWEGVLITILVITGFRRAIFNAVPRTLRSAISVGIGLFIAFIGLVDAGVVRTGNPIVQLGIFGSLQGWPILLFVVVLLLLVTLFVRKVKGAILLAILSGTVLAVIIESVLHLGGKTDDNPTGWMLNVPTLGEFSAPNFTLLGRVDLFGAFAGGPAVVLGLLLLVFSLLLSDFFDTMGTIVAVGAETATRRARKRFCSSTPSPPSPVAWARCRPTLATSSRPQVSVRALGRVSRRWSPAPGSCSASSSPRWSTWCRRRQQPRHWCSWAF